LEKEEWISILRLATKWRFLIIRKIAMKKLENFEISNLESIILGREMKISKLLIEGYTGVVAVSKTISDEDAAVIGLQTTVKLFQLRDRRTGDRGRISDTIRVALKDEFLGILAVEVGYNTPFKIKLEYICHLYTFTDSPDLEAF
jgi:hypothetical protein